MKKTSKSKLSRRKDDTSNQESHPDQPADASSQVPSRWLTVDRAILTLQLAIYVIGQVIACKVEFGAVFFCCSVLYVIWCSLDDRKRGRHEPSAYSVFNRNLESIDGTTTADQLTRQAFGGL